MNETTKGFLRDLNLTLDDLQFMRSVVAKERVELEQLHRGATARSATKQCHSIILALDRLIEVAKTPAPVFPYARKGAL